MIELESSTQLVTSGGGSTSVTLTSGITSSTETGWLSGLGVMAQTTIPAIVPASQLLFWTSAWRAAEAEADADYQAGRVQSFNRPDDLVRWLLSTDDD